jgi:hypothetical protein
MAAKLRLERQERLRLATSHAATQAMSRSQRDMKEKYRIADG